MVTSEFEQYEESRSSKVTSRRSTDSEGVVENMAQVIEKYGISISFEDMKSEFKAMDREIKEKTEEIRQLRQAVVDAQKRYEMQEKESAKNVDEMEELHENLAELDGRFERSEKLNHKLREELELTKHEVQRKDEELCKSIIEAETNLRESKDKYVKLENEFESFKTDMNMKYDSLRTSLKGSVEDTYKSVSDYLERKRSRRFSRKGRSYRMLLTLESELLSILASFKDS